MVIGVPREIKEEEYRVGVIPAGVRELKKDGHTVLVEEGAGTGSGFSDNEYLDADADVTDRETLFGKADLVVKVKEPLPSEFPLFRESQAVFTYLHLAPNRKLLEFLLSSGITGLGYETLLKDGGLPLLSPMSEIAGRMAPIVGSYYLQAEHGGTGVLPTGMAGVKPGKALVLGAGVVGTNSARVCSGLGMDTVVISKGADRLQRIDELFMGRVKTLPVTMHNVELEIPDCDIIIGAVLVPGGRTPMLITREMLATMKKGAVIVDVSIDQGGCTETSHPTTHNSPVYTVDGVLHYAVANMPGAYPRTSTHALTNSTLPYIRTIASLGIERAIKEDASIRSALNTYHGAVVHEALAESTGVPFRDLDELTGGSS
jgi:alanine dehydrogenase